MKLIKRGCKPKSIILVALMLAVLFTLAPWNPGTLAPVALAATANPSPASTGYEQIILYIPGAITATATPIVWKSPWPYRVLSISAYARSIATAGTPTYTVDVKQGSTSLLSTPISIATTQAATIMDGVLAATPNIVDEANVSVILTLGGSTPSMTDTTVRLGVKRQ
jgi:hypothetical protein